MNVDSRRKILRHTRELNLHRRRASPILYQLSYIPAFNVEFHIVKLMEGHSAGLLSGGGSMSWLSLSSQRTQQVVFVYCNFHIQRQYFFPLIWPLRCIVGSTLRVETKIGRHTNNPKNEFLNSCGSAWNRNCIPWQTDLFNQENTQLLK